jgi:hypothetical protein
VNRDESPVEPEEDELDYFNTLKQEAQQLKASELQE